MTTVLITGGHSGIGLEASKRLASRGTNVVLAGRSPARMTETARTLRAAHNVKVTTLELDTSSLDSVRAAAARTKELIERGEIEPLSALLCNAGGRFDGPDRYSVDGYEITFATNCLGHFLLTELLTPVMTDDARVTHTVSGTHNPDTWEGRMVGAAVDPDATALAGDGKNGSKPLSAGKRYSTSKLVEVMYVYELARRFKSAGSRMTAIAFDPGSNPSTGFLRGMPGPVRWVSNTAFTTFMFKRLGFATSTPTLSGGALADLAIDRDDRTGIYIEAREGAVHTIRSSKSSYDTRRALTLWNESERLAHLRPDEKAPVLA